VLGRKTMESEVGNLDGLKKRLETA